MSIMPERIEEAKAWTNDLLVLQLIDDLVEQLEAAQRQLKIEGAAADANGRDARRLEEQLETTRDILQGFLWDADNNDRPSEGMREKARAVLYPASAPDAQKGGTDA